VNPEYRAAFDQVMLRVQQQLRSSQPDAFPIRVYVTGGAALHLFTGERITEDVDATFSKKVLLNEDIEMSYRDPDGRARVMYLDRKGNGTAVLVHAQAYEDSKPIAVTGIDKELLEVRLLSPVDLAVSKLAPFADQDRKDVELLARKKLIDSRSLRQRATEALQGYGGDLTAVRTSIDVACRLIDSIQNP
jgi:hypothetical protein